MMYAHDILRAWKFAAVNLGSTPLRTERIVLFRTHCL